MAKPTGKIIETSETVAEAPVKKGLSKFSKKQILASNRYADMRDLLSALLKGGETYSHDDINKLIDEFNKRKVK